MPSTTGGQAAPTLRSRPARDVDLPAAAGGSRGGFALGGDGPEMRLTPKSDEQQLQALQSAFAEAGAHGVPQVDQRAAETLLHRIKPNVDADRRWTEKPESIAKTAAIGLSLVIVAQLSIMGLLALWRFMRRPKARQVQPRWTTI